MSLKNELLYQKDRFNKFLTSGDEEGLVNEIQKLYDDGWSLREIYDLFLAYEIPIGEWKELIHANIMRTKDHP